MTTTELQRTDDDQSSYDRAKVEVLAALKRNLNGTIHPEDLVRDFICPLVEAAMDDLALDDEDDGQDDDEVLEIMLGQSITIVGASGALLLRMGKELAWLDDKGNATDAFPADLLGVYQKLNADVAELQEAFKDQFDDAKRDGA